MKRKFDVINKFVLCASAWSPLNTLVSCMYQAIDAQTPPDAQRTDTRAGHVRPHPYYDGPADMPLFGDARPVDRVLNVVVGILTALLVLVTLVSALAFPGGHPKALNIFFSVCLFFICCSHLVLIYWYRQGDLEPRFRTLIYYNAFSIILLCVCANLYIHKVA